MPDFQVFELPEMAKILGVDLAKAKNWTNERTGLVIQPSIRQATGTGSRNLYSTTDLYLMGIAREFSKAGFAPKAIGKLLDALKPELAGLRRAEGVTVWRLKPGGPFHLAQGRTRPEGITVWHTVALRLLLDGIDEAVEKFSG
jgi:DNA-binding transcriptional MerR regulator